MLDKIKQPNMIEEVPSSFTTHEFSKTVFNTDIKFSVLKMEQSVLIWIGLKEQRHFSDLCLGLQSKFSDMPLSTHLFGNSPDGISKSFVSKIAKKLHKPVYLSYNVPDNQMMPEVIKSLVSEIENNPQYF
nr:proteasome assembly chaperone 4-like [Halyomorpha halys]